MKKFPNALTIILSIILLSWILTYIIPKGEYTRVIDPETNYTQVVNNSYHRVEAIYLSPFELLLAIPRGIIGRADTIVLILLIGGCFYVIERTGAFMEGLNKLVGLLKGKESLSLIIVSALFTAGGATIGMQEELIAMTPLLLLFGKSLGFNAFTVIYMSYGSAVLGSSLSPSNPFAVIIAQKEAQLPLLSGSYYRLIVLGVAFVFWVWFIIRYAKKNRVEKVVEETATNGMSPRSQIILTLLALTFAIVIYGLLRWDWGFNEMSASFFGLGILAGMIGGLGANRTCEMYIAGFKEMIFAALLIGLANSISLILKEGNVIDSIVYGLFGPLQYFPAEISGVVMMVSHTLLHFPIPSYSGQAVLTMPILVPLSDLIGLSRQTCVLAYQYGAVMMDLLVPTNGALMAVLAISSISYATWFRFAIKPLLMILGLAAVAIVLAVLIGYN